MSNVSQASSLVKKKTIYRVKNWAAYNRAMIARGGLTLWLDDSVLSSGYMALTLRRLLHLPLRQTQGFVESLLVLMGLDEWLDGPDLFDVVASSR